MLHHLPLISWFSDDESAAGYHPWPRYRLSTPRWRELLETLPRRDWRLLDLWAEPDQLHIALQDQESPAGEIIIATLACPAGYPALSPVRPGAARLERTVRDLYGLEALGAADRRPWLDHGRFGQSYPLAEGKEGLPQRDNDPTTYPFLPVEGSGIHQIPVGPVHAGIIEPGHFRFHANGETIVRLEERLGYVHKGIEGLLIQRPLAEAARIVARISGDSTVAYSFAFANAVEAALNFTPSPRATRLRAIMAELERIANHLGDIGAIANDAAFSLMHAHCFLLREELLQTCQRCFGHRLLMDGILPGGVARDLTEEGVERLGQLESMVRERFEEIVHTYDNKPSLLDRTGRTGILEPELAHRFGIGGTIARASGQKVDARRAPGYAPYSDLDFSVPTLTEGDVNARVWIRIEEVRNSLGLLVQLLAGLPTGEIWRPLPVGGGEGSALVEGFRGDIWLWVRLAADGSILRCRPRDPSWFQWPLLERVVKDNIVADFPLCNKSFNCSYSGHDL